MCGIAGIVAIGSAARGRARARCRDARRHRASRADDAGLFVDGQAALGHRRLSIVDLAAGQQPLSNEDGTIWIVFNGEIYNHADVRPELEAAGHVYRTRSDTETIVHAYEQWGDACVERFRGMFAFAIWDAPRRRLLLARDRLGVKPLYWARRGDRLLFGSEIKAILESGLVARRGERGAIPELLSTRYLVRRRDAVQGHPPAAAGPRPDVRATARSTTARSTGTSRPATRDERPRATLGRGRGRGSSASCSRKRSASRLMADVPLGMFLSGGLDSSAIAALMARHDRPAAADLLGRVQGARVQRARLRAPGGDARSRPTRTRS